LADRIEEAGMRGTGETVVRQEIRRVPVVPFALITATIMAIWVLILAIVVAIIGGAALATIPFPFPVAAEEAAAGGIIGIILSIVFAFIGTFIFNAVAALLYNALAPRIGGIRVDLW